MGQPAGKTTREVKGNTLRVYLYLLHTGNSELRDVQKSLGFSTPSLASYHLGKLVEAGYVSQDEKGKYGVVKDSTNEILEGYVRIGAVVFPQLFFFSVLFTGVIGFLAFASFYSSSYVPLLAGASVALVAAFWYETVKVWRRLTSWT
ncbi:MAG: winged helix-turn-helix domain-containing protein [Thaumarchaeota archaeon]|nr:winged helix-turn-helix domain-containing protein [Nitrososphaerota archaeon]